MPAHKGTKKLGASAGAKEVAATRRQDAREKEVYSKRGNRNYDELSFMEKISEGTGIHSPDPVERKNAKAKAESFKARKGYAKGGKVSTASKRADGCATKGKTKGRFV